MLKKTEHLPEPELEWKYCNDPTPDGLQTTNSSGSCKFHFCSGKKKKKSTLSITGESTGD